MKKRTIVLLSVLGAILLTASIATPIVVTTVVKQKQKENEIRKLVKEYYNNKVESFKQENEELKGKNVDVTFIGDSLTDLYDVKKYYPQYTVANRGIGGDTTTGVINRLDVSVYQIKPKVATLLIGVNNIRTMLNDYEDILKGFQTNIPDTKIVLLSLTSMTKDWGRNNKIARDNNVKIKEYADKYNYTYVDLYNPLLDPNTNELRMEYTTDGGHFTDEGYVKITSVITPVLYSILGY